MTRKPATGAEALVGALEGLGVRHVFGLPGTQNVELFEALRTARLRTVVPTSELAAAFMAGAYYRTCGRPGIVVTIPGPGFAYALAGLAEARLDSAAVVHVTGAPPSGPGNRFRLQELRQADIARPLVKAVIAAGRPESVADVVQRAYALALAGEPGPVLVEVADAAFGPLPDRWAVAPVRAEPSGGDPDPVLDRLRRARRAVIVAGQGARAAAGALQELAERLGAPVVTTGSGRGVVPEDHPLAMGYDNARGTVDVVNALFGAADLVLVLGAKLGHNGTAGFAMRFPADRTIQVDTDPDVLGANYPVAAPVATSVEAFLERAAGENLVGAWPAAEVGEWRARFARPVAGALEPRMGGRSAAEFVRELRNVLPRKAVLVTDSGLHQIVARRHFEVRAPGGLLAPSDLQAMGFGLPAAIGAKLAAPERQVVALVGDGGFAMGGLELGTMVREGLDLVVLVCRDGYLGQIRLQQLGEYGSAHGTSLPETDYAAAAEAVGARYMLAGSGVEAVPPEALRGGVWLVEVPVGDSARMVARQARGGLRRVARGAIRGRARSFLKRVLRKLLP